MKKPVNVGIPYSNEQEREWAITQAEKLGYRKWGENFIKETDNCIYLEEDGDWLDSGLDESIKTIPLERPDGSNTDVGRKAKEELDLSKYNVEHKADGTIILTPKKKVKVWIEVFLSNGKIYTCEYYSLEDFEKNKSGGEKYPNSTFLELIEKEYEI